MSTKTKRKAPIKVLVYECADKTWSYCIEELNLLKGGFECKAMACYMAGHATVPIFKRDGIRPVDLKVEGEELAK
jgi:hypothetical protein